MTKDSRTTVGFGARSRLCLLAVVLSVSVPTMSAAAQVTRSITFVRHTTVDFAERQADLMNSFATNLLKRDDAAGSADVACNVTFQRFGGVSRMSSTDGDIDTNSESALILDSANGYVKIVDNLNWCGKRGTFSGCSNGRSLMMSDETAFADRAGGTLAHEFGHTVGLVDAVDDQARIMFKSLANVTQNRVTQSECDAFKNVPIDFNGPGGHFRRIEPPVVPMDLAAVPIEAVVRDGFLNAVPVEVVDYYTQADVEILKDMLADPDTRKNHHTIVSLIGLLSDGSDADAQVLIDYAIGARRTDDALAAGIGLGYMVAQTANVAAREHLLDMTRARRDTPTVKGGIMGLGLTGDLKARDRLQALGQAASNMRGRMTEDEASQRAELIVQSLDDNEIISERGLIGYYRDTPR